MNQSSTMIFRRQLLKAGGFGMLNLAMPGVVAARVNVNQAPRHGAAEFTRPITTGQPILDLFG
jgi:hypothetical protein